MPLTECTNESSEPEAPEDDPASFHQVGTSVLRKGEDPADHALHFGMNSAPSPGRSASYHAHGFEELLLGCRKEWELTHFSSARAFANTSSEGMVWTSPLR